MLDAACSLLRVTHDELDQLALSVPAGADGLVMVPYLAGERTPNIPEATGGLLGLTLDNSTPGHIARAAIEGMLCGLADAVDALAANGASFDRVRLIGGAAASSAVRTIAAEVFGRSVVVPPAGEYVADGAARQAAWALGGSLPVWQADEPAAYVEATPQPRIRVRYAEAREHWLRKN